MLDLRLETLDGGKWAGGTVCVQRTGRQDYQDTKKPGFYQDANSLLTILIPSLLSTRYLLLFTVY